MFSNQMIKTARCLTLQCVLLSGAVVVAMTPPGLQPVYAAETSKEIAKEAAKESVKDAAKTPSNYLHDGEKTVNPWGGDAANTLQSKKSLVLDNDRIRSSPREAWTYISRSDTYLQLMMPKEALKDVDMAIALKPKDSELLQSAYCNRGEALLQLKQYKAALADLEKACLLDAKGGEAFYFRGMAKEKLGQLPQAIKDYDVARSLDFSPKRLEVDFSDYMDKLQRKIKSHWHPPKSKTTKRAIVLFKITRDGAVPLLKIYKTSGATDVDAAAILAVQQAAPFEPLPKGSPKNVDIEFNFDYNVHGGGVVSFLQHATEKWDTDEADALKKLTEAKKGKDESVVTDAELKLAKIYSARGKYPAAIELYQSALKELEKQPEKQLTYGKAYGHLALVYSLQGKNAEAEVEFKKSLEIVDKESGFPSDPEVVEILKEYGKVLYKSNKIAEANKIFARLKQ